MHSQEGGYGTSALLPLGSVKSVVFVGVFRPPQVRRPPGSEKIKHPSGQFPV